MIGYQTLSAAIISKVQSSTFVKSSEVYDYSKTGIAGYPAVTVTPYEGDGVISDTVRNQRRFIFSIKVLVNRLEDPAGAERVARQTVDDLIHIFDSDHLLGNAIQGVGFCRPIPAKWGYNQGEGIDVRIAELQLEIVLAQ